jgi:hypothetical protein
LTRPFTRTPNTVFKLMLTLVKLETARQWMMALTRGG